MYPDLYKGLKLRFEDLTYYDSPLIGFDGKVVFLKGQIRLPVQTRTEVVEVNFIVVDAYSLTPLLWQGLSSMLRGPYLPSCT